MRRARLVGLLSSLLLSSCYFSVDWDGLAGAPSDAGAADVAVIGDATTDAADAAEAGMDAAESCPDGGFCDDFERTAVLGGWETTDIVPGNTLSITDHAYAGAGALRTTLSGDQGARALLSKGFPASTSFRLRYQLFTSSIVARANGITPISIGYSNRVEILIPQLEGDSFYLAEQELTNPGGAQDAYQQIGSGTVRTNEWVEVILEVTLGSTAHAKLTYGGAVIADQNLANTYGADRFRVNLGANYALKGDAESFDIDDVQVTWTPTP